MSRRTSSTQRPSPGQRVTIGTVTGIVIIGIVLVAQFVFGIDLLNTESTSTPAATVPPAATRTAIPTAAAGTPVAAAPGGEAVAIPGGIDGGWYQLYFTDPINTTDPARFVDAPAEDALVAAIDGANSTIDAAVFELNARPVTDALLRAHARGVVVRIVTDDEHGLEDPDSTLEELEFEGIAVRSDAPRTAFMHNKFFVLDSLYVWTGSTNITQNGFYNNNNNAILIRSRQLAENYAAEFEELWAGNFGRTSANNVPNPAITVNGTQIETFFESEGAPDFLGYQSEPSVRIAELMGQAHSVRFLTFVLTRDDLMTPMIAGAEGGWLDVQGIVESSQRRFIAPLYCTGVEVRQDGNPNILHHKVIILDDTTVVMGSFNFTASAADDNDENVLIIHNRDIASAFLDEFDRRWAESNPVPADAFDC